jgi:hypothetical protein
MSGLDRETPLPTALTVHQASRVLEIAFNDGAQFRIPFELMRVYSPSAEVQGHGPGQEVLQTGKRDVGIEDLQAVGHYAIQPRFSGRARQWHLLLGLPVHLGQRSGRTLAAVRAAPDGSRHEPRRADDAARRSRRRCASH